MANKTKKVKVGSTSEMDPNAEDLRAIIVKLRSELDAERKTTRQLRREKANEVQQTREQEQGKASLCLRDLAFKLHEEKQREVELQKEALRSRLEADSGKAMKLKDQEVKKLKQDLVRCQEELKEEVTKRGLSTSARGTFEKERNKLLQEVKELSTSRKQLEGAVAAAADAEKRRSLEFRQLQDSCRLELARVEKEANVEVKKLLEELKSKDNMLAMIDRNLYPERSSMLKQRVENLSIQELLNLSREVEKMNNIPEEVRTARDVSVVAGGCALQTIALQKKLYELEKQLKFANSLHQAIAVKNNALTECNLELEAKVKLLTGQLNNLNCELSTNKAEIGRLNDVLVASTGCHSNEPSSTSTELESYKQQHADLQQILDDVRLESQDKDRRIALLIKSQEKQKQKRPPKSVRFLLPDIDEGNSELNEKGDNEIKSASIACNGTETKQDRHSDEMLIQSLHRDYEKLMEEHMRLEKHCASLVQTQPQVLRFDHQNWMLEKESLQIAVWALEDKLRKMEENEQLTRCQLEEAHDQNEELEFRILELEECTERTMSTFYDKEDVELMEKNCRLEIQVLLLTKRLSQYESIDIGELERDVTLADTIDHPANEFTDSFGERHQRLSRENLRKLTASLSDSDDENPMVQSFSTMTSGFDEISCISLDLDKVDTIEALNTDLKTCSGENESRDKMLSNACELPKRETDVAGCDEVVLSGITADSSDVDLQDTSFTEPLHKLGLESKTYETYDDLERNNISLSNSELPTDTQFTLDDGENVQRIKDLQDQVVILEQNDVRFAETIRALDEIEQKLISSIDENSMHQINQDYTLVSDDTDHQFWAICQQEIDADIDILEQILSQVAPYHRPTEITAVESDNRAALQKCVEKLKRIKMYLDNENCAELQLCKTIKQLESAESTQFEDENLIAQFSLMLAEDKLLSLSSVGAAHSCTSEFQKVKSLKRYALEAVTIEIKKDFEEMKTLAETFMNNADSDPLQSTARDVNVQCLKEERLLAPAEKRLNLTVNTELPCTRETLGFLSPTSLDSDWLVKGPLELVMNYTLQQQVKDLEKERDALKELFYRDAHAISEQKMHISELEACIKSLREENDTLGLSERQTVVNLQDLSTQYTELKSAVKKLESNEAFLKSQIDACESSEFALKMKLQSALAAREKTETKFKTRIAELEMEKLNIEHHAEEMSNLIERLEAKERSLRQRGKSLESNKTSSQEKLYELESALGAAYDEVSKVNRQKDCLNQKMSLLEDQTCELQHEVLEIKEELARVVAENSKLIEEDGFLREANQKMWLSLHANLKGLGSEPVGMNTVEKEDTQDSLIIIENNLNADPQSTGRREGMNQNSSQCVQPSQQPSCESTQVTTPGLSTDSGSSDSIKRRKVVIQNAKSAFRQTLKLLGIKYPRIQAEFIATAIKASSLSRFSQSPEAMQKFITSLQFRCSDPHNIQSSISHATTPAENPAVGKQEYSEIAEDSHNSTLVEEAGDSLSGDRLLWQPARGEETFWAAVEDTSDIYDVRAADRASFWVDLESIMGVNYEGSELILEFSNPLQTHASSSLAAQQTNLRSTQTFMFPPGPTASAGSTTEPSPIPSEHLPESDSPDVIVDQSRGAKPRKEEESMKEDEGTQTEAANILHSEEPTALLRMQLEQKDRNLLAKIHEVDRVTQEMRRWQQKAVAAADETVSVSAALAAARDELNVARGLYGTDGSSSSSKLAKKSRLKPYVSQIPVSVRQAVDHYKSIDLRSSPGAARSAGSSVTSQAHGPVTSYTHQESVHTASYPLTKPLKLGSYIPRPIGEKYQSVKQANGSERKTETSSNQPVVHGMISATAAEGAAVEAAAAESEQEKPSADEGTTDV